MPFNTIKFLSLFIIFVTTSVYAEVVCSKPTRANDIIRCLQDQHPEIIKEDQIKTVAERLSVQGNSWKNPEISFETVGGESLGTSLYDSEIRLSQTIEFSGQQKARKSLGQAKGEIFKSENLEKIEEVTLIGVRLLFRLNQIIDEKNKINEAVDTFKKIKSQYQGRIQLTPEQDTTLGIIQLVISDFEIKLNQLSLEQFENLKELSVNSGFNHEEILKNLPSKIVNWPNTPITTNDIQSSALLKSKIKVDETRAELDLARAEAWPEFKIDLIVQNKIEGSYQYQMFGAGFTLPLPFFQRNEGEKKLKAIEHFKAQNIYSAEMKKHSAEALNLMNTYENSVKNLKSTPSEDFIDQKHKKAERLFNQGLISGPLIIETHKQILEYTQTRNTEELRAIESLWKLYIMNGTFLNQKI